MNRERFFNAFRKEFGEFPLPLLETTYIIYESIMKRMYSRIFLNGNIEEIMVNQTILESLILGMEVKPQYLEHILYICKMARETAWMNSVAFISVICLSQI